MLPNRQLPPPPIVQENPLWISWHDTQMMAILNSQTVMDYFCRKSNPFYDRTCNNETIRMQRLSLEHLNNMVGVEYILLHVSEPILYVIRKQHRHSPTEATPMADYYIIGGMVYKAPDLASVFNSRILSAVTNLQSAFEEASSYARYHPNKGYTWDFTTHKALSEKSKAAAKKDPAANKEDTATAFQKQRVDMLLVELLRKFPPPVPPIVHQQQLLQQQQQQQTNAENSGNPTAATATTADGNVITNGGAGVSTPVVSPKVEVPMGAGVSTTAAGSAGSNKPGLQPVTSPMVELKTELNEMKPPPEKKLKMQV